MFIDRIYRINHTDTWNLNAPILVTSASYKIATKMRYSTSKDTAFDGETTLRHTIPCSYSQCLPPPRRSQNPVRITWVSDQRKIIHYGISREVIFRTLKTDRLIRCCLIQVRLYSQVSSWGSWLRQATSLSKLKRRQINQENWLQESLPPWTRH